MWVVLNLSLWVVCYLPRRIGRRPTYSGYHKTMIVWYNGGMTETQTAQEILAPQGNLITQQRPQPKQEPWMCWARVKTCRLCKHRYLKEEYERWNCPDCGTDRHCIAPKVGGYPRCTKHGGGEPNKGKLTGRPRSNRYTDVLSSDMVRDYRSGLSDPELLVLRDEIALCDARKKQLLARTERYGPDEEADQDKVWKQINRLQEQGRKLRGSELERLVKLQQYITKERAVAFTRAVASAVQDSLGIIKDDKLRLQVRNAFEVRLSRVMQTRRKDLVDLLVEPLA
jgi:hypothetical protein